MWEGDGASFDIHVPTDAVHPLTQDENIVRCFTVFYATTAITPIDRSRHCHCQKFSVTCRHRYLVLVSIGVIVFSVTCRHSAGF